MPLGKALGSENTLQAFSFQQKKSHTVNLVSSTQPLQISIAKVQSLVESLSDRLVGVAGPLDKTMIGVVINPLSIPKKLGYKSLSRISQVLHRV